MPAPYSDISRNMARYRSGTRALSLTHDRERGGEKKIKRERERERERARARKTKTKRETKSESEKDREREREIQKAL